LAVGRKQRAECRRQEAGNSGQLAGSRKQELRSRRQLAVGRKQEAGSMKQEAGGKKIEVRTWICNHKLDNINPQPQPEKSNSKL
jgi:hypothetical protein